MNKSSRYFLSSLGFMLLSALRPMKPLWARIVPVGTLVAVTLVGIALVGIAPALAVDGRDFAGSWRVENVTDLGDEVRLTLHLRVYNYSDADVVGGTILLTDRLAPGASYGSFLGVDIRDRESVGLFSDVIIPRAEYDYWAIGGHPCLHIEFTDASADAVSRTIELHPMLPGEE